MRTIWKKNLKNCIQNRPRFMSSGANHAVVSEKTKQQHSLYIHSYSMSERRSAVVILTDKNWNGIHSFCFRLQQTCQFDATSSKDVPACDHQNQQGSCAFSLFHFPVISYTGGSLFRLGLAYNYCMACIHLSYLMQKGIFWGRKTIFVWSERFVIAEQWCQLSNSADPPLLSMQPPGHLT